MQRLGRVLHISPSGNIITKIESATPKIGDMIIDEQLKPVGKVFDIIGSTSSPYAVVKPMTSQGESLVDRTLYVSPRRGERRTLNE